jgi:hypothetical protein
MPVGMDRFEQALWEQENQFCEKCSGMVMTSKHGRINTGWNRDNWSPGNHDEVLLGGSEEKLKPSKNMVGYAYFEEE